MSVCIWRINLCWCARPSREKRMTDECLQNRSRSSHHFCRRPAPDRRDKYESDALRRIERWSAAAAEAAADSLGVLRAIIWLDLLHVSCLRARKVARQLYTCMKWDEREMLCSFLRCANSHTHRHLTLTTRFLDWMINRTRDSAQESFLISKTNLAAHLRLLYLFLSAMFLELSPDARRWMTPN